MRPVGDHLFKGKSFLTDSELRERLKEKVWQVSDDLLRSHSAADIRDELYTQLVGRPVHLDMDGRQVSKPEKIKYDVSGQFSRGTEDETDVYVEGGRFIVKIPFKGDPGYFNLEAKVMDFNPPRGFVQGNMICFGGEIPLDSVHEKQELQEYIRKTEAAIIDNLETQNAKIERSNRDMYEILLQEIQIRKKQVSESDDLASSL